MLRRKIDAEFEAFLKGNAKESLLVTGARQVGKTFSIRGFAMHPFKDFVEINFIERPEAKALFDRTRGTVDFFSERDNAVLPIEAKSGNDYDTHAALDNMLAEPSYELRKALVQNACGDSSTDGKITYRPVYATMFLKRNPLPEKMVFKVDLSALRQGN